jgi:hypothetical protein
MHSHGLCRVFDTASCTQSIMPAQWIIRRAVATGATPDALLVPGFHAIQQAHAALMRDMARNPGVIQADLV